MRIAIIVPALTRKGPVIVARDLASGFMGAGHDVIVFYLTEKKELNFPCQVEKFNLSSIEYIRQCDVVHSHSLRPDALAWSLKNLFGFEQVFVSTIHNYVEQDLKLAYGRIVSLIFSFIWRKIWVGLDGCVVLTEHAKKYYEDSHLKINLDVVYNGRPSHHFKGVSSEDELLIRELKANFGIIGTAALVTQRKGLDQVVKALPMLPGYAFLVIGDGPYLEELKSLAKTLDVGDRVLFLGFRSNARDYFPFMDVYAMPSLSEGMPLAMLEAVDGEVPVVCSDIPVFREIFTDDEVAFFSLNDISGLVASVVKVENNLQNYKLKAKIKFSEKYSVNAMVSGYLNFYQKFFSRNLI